MWDHFNDNDIIAAQSGLLLRVSTSKLVILCRICRLKNNVRTKRITLVMRVAKLKILHRA